MKRYHLAMALDWEYDQDFIKLLEQAAHKRGLSTYVAWPKNLVETIYHIKNDTLSFRFFYDRASDTSPEFLALHKLMLQKNIPVFDTWNKQRWAADKANMQYKFTEVGINTPFTLILPSWRDQPYIHVSEDDLGRLGSPFVIKPSHTTGGGIGVVKNARSLKDILEVRQTFPNERYLVQKKIVPKEQEGRRFWFRGFYTCGLIQLTWWNDLTYGYELCTPQEIERYGLLPLFGIVRSVARACGLNFFSTEITIDETGDLIAIDYVNEVCDMRLGSKSFDGVPDGVVRKIAGRIVDHVAEKLNTVIFP